MKCWNGWQYTWIPNQFGIANSISIANLYFPVNSILCCLWVFNPAWKMMNSNKIYLDDSVGWKRMASRGITEWYQIPAYHTGMLKEKMWLMNNYTVESTSHLYNRSLSEDGLLCHLHGHGDQSPLLSREEWHLDSICLYIFTMDNASFDVPMSGTTSTL